MHGTQLGGRGAVDNIVNEPAGAASNTTSMPTDSINRQTNTKIVINELLTYVRFYRDRGNNVDLHKQIAHFYLPNEISASKTAMHNEFQIYLNDSPYVTLRRQTSARSAHEAEIDDILGMFDVLDNLNVLSSIQFAAMTLDRIPKHVPNAINIYTVVNRQICVDQDPVN